MPKISVIVPIYNVEPYIDKCLNSLVNQTLKDIEIICVDDCGVDASMETVDQYADLDERIIVLHNDKNQGLSVLRNRGIAVARSPYIMFCDADDWCELNMCEKMLKAIEAQNADIGLCGVRTVYEKDNKKTAIDEAYFDIPYSGTYELSEIELIKYSVCVWNKIFRRDILLGHKIEFPEGVCHEDEFFYRAYLIWVKKTALLQDKLYFYRRHIGSITCPKIGEKDVSEDLVESMICFQKYLVEQGVWRKYYDYFWRYCFMPCFIHSSSFLANTERYAKNTARAADLIDKTYDYNVDDYHLHRTLDLIRKRKFSICKKRILGGIFEYCNSYDRFFFKFLGIPILKIKFGEDKKKCYFCGILVYQHKK